ncbi:hypothetical protein ACHQM5_012234 [Ranunculus cassubicifolius]
MVVAGNDVVTCLPYQSTVSRGIWLGDTPLKFTTPIFMVQIALSAIIPGIIDFYLGRYGMCSFFSHMLEFFQDYVFPWGSLCLLETIQYIGCVFFLFLVGLKMDFRMVNAFGRKARIIGISVGVFPVIFTVFLSYFFKDKFFVADEKAGYMLCAVGVTEAQTSFHVVVCLLADLKMLNSEIGRLAAASSVVSNICSWCLMIFLLAATETVKVGKWEGLYIVVTYSSLFLFVIYVLKPITHWMIKQVPQGTNNMKQVHVFMVFLMVLVVAMIGQLMGHPPGTGPLLLGVVIPPGPPLAETIEYKLESITSPILLPLTYVAITGKFASLGADRYSVMFVLLISVLAFLAKIIATLVPSIYCGITLHNSLVLGLIFASQGLVDLIHYGVALDHERISGEAYTVLIYFTVVIAGMTSILVKMMYKPSVDRLAYSERSLADNTNNTEFRILTCIYQDYNVPSVIGLLQASNATDESPINLHLLHLIELRRVAPPLLISHKENDGHSIYYNRSKHIIKAFQSFVKPYNKRISLCSFSALSPSETMHQDICSLAVDKRISLIILPFHRQFDVDGLMEAKATIRNVNSSVLKLSPCSVGILIDRRRMSVSSSTTSSNSFFHIALIFLGGADDREALTYAMRMVEYPNITLTVIRFSLKNDRDRTSNQKKLDEELLDEFHRRYKGKEGIDYREEEFSDGFGIAKAISKPEDYSFDLIMVGRQHGNESKLFNGLSEWNEFPELGLIGDMLATSNLHQEVSILVLQQKYKISDDLVPRINYKIRI